MAGNSMGDSDRPTCVHGRNTKGIKNCHAEATHTGGSYYPGAVCEDHARDDSEPLAARRYGGLLYGTCEEAVEKYPGPEPTEEQIEYLVGWVVVESDFHAHPEAASECIEDIIALEGAGNAQSLHTGSEQ